MRTAVTCAVLLTLHGQAVIAAAAEKKVLILASQQGPPYDQVIEGFRETLARMGLKASYDSEDPGGAVAAGEGSANDLSGTYDLCLVVGTAALTAAARANLEIPVVASLVLPRSDALSALPQAKGVTLTFPLKDQAILLREMLPQARTAAVLYNPAENTGLVKEAQEIFRTLGLTLLPVAVNSPGELPAALRTVSRQADVLWGIPDKLVMNPRTAKEIILFSFRNRIPLAGLSPSWVKAGALYSPSWDYRDIGRQCGAIAGGILRGNGARAAAWTGPEKMQYVINDKTARRLKVEIEDDVMNGAAAVH